MKIWPETMQEAQYIYLLNHTILKLLKPGPSSNPVIRVTRERNGSNQSFIPVPTFHDFKLLKPNSLENCTIGCHKYVCTWPCFLFNHMSISYELGGRYKKLLKRRGYWSLLRWTNYNCAGCDESVPFPSHDWSTLPRNCMLYTSVRVGGPGFCLHVATFSANPLIICI